MAVSRKYVIGAGLVLVAATIALIIIAKSPESTESIRVGILRHASTIPYLVADEQGFFESQGLSIEMIELSPQEHMQALLTGRVDIISPSSFPIIFSTYIQHPDLIVGFLVGGERLDGDLIYGLLVKSDSDIKDANDIRGKRLGSISPYTTINLKNIAVKLGIDPESELHIQEMSREILIATLDRGDIVAAILDQPTLGAAARLPGFKIIEPNIRARHLGNPYWSGCGIANRQWIQNQSDQFESFLHALDEALDWVEEHPRDSKLTMQRYFELTVEESVNSGMYYYLKSNDPVDFSFLSQLGEEFRNAGILDVTVDVRGLFRW